MKRNGFEVVREFEQALCEYTGAKYAVCTSSCTMALTVICAYLKVGTVTIPKFTYHGVPMAILNAGGKVEFDNRQWRGSYRLRPYPIWDSARRFTSAMYIYVSGFECVSFHWDKILGIQQGGAILHDNAEAQDTLHAMTRDGAHWSKPVGEQQLVRGFHCYLSPELAAAGIRRLSTLPKHNEDLPNSDYSDLSKQDIFK